MVLVTTQRKAEVLDLLRKADFKVKRIVEVLPPMDTGDLEEVLWIDTENHYRATEIDSDKVMGTRYGW